MENCTNSTIAWQEESRRVLDDYRIFKVTESVCRSPQGEEASFRVIETKDWAIVVPFLPDKDGGNFLMVRQWRHGSRCESVEFPGGVIEQGETAFQGATRELREETGCQAASLRELACISPNPAIMNNHVHIFLAEDLAKVDSLRLDADEFLTVEPMPVAKVIADLGKPPFLHGLMSAAMFYFVREKGFTPNNA